MHLRAGAVLLPIGVLAACDGSPANVDVTAAAYLDVTLPDSLGVDQSVRAGVQVLDAQRMLLSPSLVQWTTSDATILSVSEAGEVTAHRPGLATVVARAGAAADTFHIRAVTSHCPPVSWVNNAANAFWGTLILPGHTNPPHSPSGTTEYRGVPLLYGAGIVFGHHRDSTLVGYDYTSAAGNDLRGGVCTIRAPGVERSLAVLSPRSFGTTSPPLPDGLLMAQEQWAFTATTNSDFVIFRHTFQNTRSTPIANFRFGVVADFDVHAAATNVGRIDRASGFVSVISADSVNRPTVGGVVLLESAIATYWEAPWGGPRPSRQDYFDVLASGVVAQPSVTAHDVRQVIGIAPVTIPAGGSRSFWYALVGGADSEQFERNAKAARSMMQFCSVYLC